MSSPHSAESGKGNCSSRLLGEDPAGNPLASTWLGRWSFQFQRWPKAWGWFFEIPSFADRLDLRTGLNSLPLEKHGIVPFWRCGAESWVLRDPAMELGLDFHQALNHCCSSCLALLSVAMPMERQNRNQERQKHQ